MEEALIVIFGLCIIFLPIGIFVSFLFKRVKNKTRFDYHLELVKDRKGTFGVVIAYLERILFGATIMTFGFDLSNYFQVPIFLKLFIIFLVLYIIVKYFDKKNEN